MGTRGDVISLQHGVLFFCVIFDFKCKFLCVDKMLGADITVKILRNCLF